MGLTRIRAEQINNIDYKQAVRAIALDNVVLSGGAPAVVDGVNLVNGDRILVAGNSDARENGIYTVSILGSGASGTWIRSRDTDQTGELDAGAIVMVTEGAVYADTQWKLITNDPVVIGTSELIFEQNSAFAFGNIYANGTAVLANTVGDTVSFVSANNIVIIGNADSSTITFSVDNSPVFNSGTFGTVNLSNTGETRYFDSDNSHYVAFRSANTVAANVSWILPSADGTNGQVLATDGAGTLLWTTGGGGGGGISWTTQANTPPLIASPGDFWYDSNGQIKYQFINDGTSNVWVDQSNPTTFVSITTGQILNANANGVGNIGAPGSAFGNVFAGFFIGDGSQLTGLPAGYTDANVVSLLSSFGSNSISTTGNITSGNITTSAIAKSGSNGVGNIGSATSTFNTVFARATSAQYADLAEIYASDQAYTPGTVVVFGGTHEITQSTKSHDTRVAGVISTDPAFLMNTGATGLPVALTGRVPCRVQGPIDKGDLVVSSSVPGTAQQLKNWSPGCVIGKSLETIADDQIKTIEIVVGRF